MRTRHVTIVGFHQLVFCTGAFLALSVLAATRAWATPPPLPIPAACSNTTPAKNAYKAGVKLGEKLVNLAWQQINDCDEVEYFLEIVDEDVSRLTLLPNASTNTICRYTGTVDGVYNALDALYGTCSDQCFLDGQFAGEISAQVYCELSIALDGLTEADEFLRGPVAVCGFNFEIGCDSQFIATSTTYENDEGVCEQYTEGEFADVFDQARNNQCAYEPEPDPSPISAPEDPNQ